MAAITMRRVSKSFGPVQVIKGVDLAIEPNEFVVFVGPSGCGKSTLLRLIAGLEDVTSGELLIGDEIVNDLPPSERGISMVFQSYALYPHMTVKENMGFGLKLARTDPVAAEERVQNAARILQIGHLLDRKPRQLSGGQRQRVAIGRAIVRSPRVFLFDEPLSNLDAALRVQMRIEIARLHRDLDATMVYVTHDQVEAMTLADRIVVLDAGHVRQFGAPLDLYQHPHDRFVAGFIGSPRMNFLPCTTDGNRLTLPNGTTLSVAAPRSGPRPTELGIRPEHLRPDGTGDATIEGEVITIERLGAESYMYVDIGQEEPLVVKAEAAVPMRHGERARIGVPAAATYLFAGDGACIERNAFH
ncbi:MAG: ABC transporter ATP-binding protein [Geminicoccaceae bacterium]